MLEPQAQIAWQGTSFDSSGDGLGQVWLTSTSGVTGRIGARGVWELASNGRAWRPWWRANLLHGPESTRVFDTRYVYVWRQGRPILLRTEQLKK